MRRFPRALLAGIGLAIAAPAAADVAPGDVVTHADRERVRELIPEELHPFTLDHFPELHMRIVATQDYPVHPKYVEATVRYACQASVDEQGRLLNYTAGQPFPYSRWAQEATRHACDLTPDDPQFALKLAWNVNHRWQAAGVDMPHFGQSLWRGGDGSTWRVMQGSYRRTLFSHRADLLPASTHIDPGTRVEWAEYSEMMVPFDMRGNGFLVFRYLDSKAKPDDAWMYVPSLRRVQRISVSQKADSLQGSDFTLEDFFLFSGYVWEPEWRFLGEPTVLAPMDTERNCFPRNVPGWRSDVFEKPGDERYFHACRFGPYNALYFVDERWQKRSAVLLEQIPRRSNHPYSRKLLWYDRETLMPLMGLAYDRDGQPLRMQWYLHDWSETSGLPANEGKQVLLAVAAAMVNVQENVSNLMQGFGATARDVSASDARRYFDVNRLRKGH